METLARVDSVITKIFIFPLPTSLKTHSCPSHLCSLLKWFPPSLWPCGLLEGSCFISSLGSAAYRGKWRGKGTPLFKMVRHNFSLAVRQGNEAGQFGMYFQHDPSCQHQTVKVAQLRELWPPQMMGVEKKGTRIPKWFPRKKKQHSLHIDLSSRPQKILPS